MHTSQFVGVWEAVDCKKTDEAGAKIEISEDARIKLTKFVDDEEEIHEGRYSIEGDQIYIIKEIRVPMTIRKMTDTEIVVESAGRSIGFKRKE